MTLIGLVLDAVLHTNQPHQAHAYGNCNGYTYNGHNGCHGCHGYSSGYDYCDACCMYAGRGRLPVLGLRGLPLGPVRSRVAMRRHHRYMRRAARWNAVVDGISGAVAPRSQTTAQPPQQQEQPSNTRAYTPPRRQEDREEDQESSRRASMSSLDVPPPPYTMDEVKRGTY